MKAPCVTLTPEELLSISPEVRSKAREAVSPKRTPTLVATNILAESRDVSEVPIIVAPISSEAHTIDLRPSEVPQQFVVAKESHILRPVLAQVSQQDLDIDDTTSIPDNFFDIEAPQLRKFKQSIDQDSDPPDESDDDSDE
jgi:citrate lyase gamma subunit